VGRVLFKPPLEQMRPGLWPTRRARTAVTEAVV